VQDVLGRDGLAADPAVGERDVLGDLAIEVVAHHQHVEVLVERVDGVRPGRVGRARQDVELAAHPQDVRGVAAAGALGVIGVDRPAAERGDRVVDVPRLVERVGVDRDLDVLGFGDAKAAVDRRRRGAPVLVELEADRAGADLVDQALGPRRVALAGQPDVERDRVGRLQHELDVARAG